MNTEANASIFERVDQNRSIKLSIEDLSKGIDNYHIDVKLSKRFSSDLKKLAVLLISQQAIPKPKNWDNSTLFKKLRLKYLDMMTVLIHRVKTDLKPEEVCFLQLATIKFILKFVKSQLDSDLTKVASRLAELRNKGSSEALAIDQRLFWLKKNYDSILYTINKQIFSELQRVEERQLAPIRNQYIPKELNFSVEMMFNPLLYTSDLSALSLLIHEYSLWNWSGNESSFIQLNVAIETLFSKRLNKIPLTALKDAEHGQESDSEIHDEMSGLFLSQAFLGTARDCKDVISEEITWLDLSENIELLFNPTRNSDELTKIRKQHGIKLWWSRRADVNTARRTLKKFLRLLKSRKLLAQLVASHNIRRSLNPVIAETVDLKVICQFLSGHISNSRLQDSIGGSQKLNAQQMKSLEAQQDQIRKRVRHTDLSDALDLLIDISRYRLHLKYFRMVHRAFNRINIITKADELKLSKDAGTLYALPTSSEIEEDEERICHHTILKADVRGSTTVTDELQNRNLNPASYFSLRFFNPINKILDTYGANKVFIEGDAIILSFLEYEQTPQQWFSVARSCGLAKDMLRIVGANNRYSNQMELPLLELGVGICYADNAPRFLYDEDKPIMISGAIGLADRMSSCSWKLRSVLKRGLFNVDVLRIAEGEHEKGEKGQQYVRYNVNGILIDDEAFSKLQSELTLKHVRMKLNGKEYRFHVGKYPDLNGRKKNLIIREGKIGIWKNEQIEEDSENDERYYEVVVNRKVNTLVLDSTTQTETAQV